MVGIPTDGVMSRPTRDSCEGSTAGVPLANRRAVGRPARARGAKVSGFSPAIHPVAAGRSVGSRAGRT